MQIFIYRAELIERGKEMGKKLDCERKVLQS